jgi:hypothetical protein
MGPMAVALVAVLLGLAYALYRKEEEGARRARSTEEPLEPVASVSDEHLFDKLRRLRILLEKLTVPYF